jgi:hypothetical protein
MPNGMMPEGMQGIRLAHPGQMAQMAQMGQMGQMGQLGQMGQMGMPQVGVITPEMMAGMSAEQKQAMQMQMMQMQMHMGKMPQMSPMNMGNLFPPKKDEDKK